VHLNNILALQKCVLLNFGTRTKVLLSGELSPPPTHHHSSVMTTQKA
jgi:hypothetical protein